MAAERKTGIDFSRWGRDRAPLLGKVSDDLLDIWAEDEDETDCLFEKGGAGLMARLNLHLVKGREKTGKSSFGVLLVTAALGGEFLGVVARKEKMRVAWIDTEQDRGTLRERARKAVEMAQDSEKGERVFVYSLKRHTPAERLRLSLEAIRESRADFVFLDGLADLCADFNDQRECAQVVGELVNAAEEAGCALLTVIHTNKTDGKEARGHVGAIAQQKAGEVYEVKRDPGSRTANVEQVLTRFARVPEMAFEFGDGDGHAPTLLPAYGGLTKQQDKERRRAEDLQKSFGELLAGGKALSYSELTDEYARLTGCSPRVAKDAIKEAKRWGIVRANKQGRTALYRLAVVEDFDGIVVDGDEA